jgi:4-hydroxybenzoate polyprenyltransferase
MVSYAKATEQARQFALLMRFHRPIGIMLLLWPTLWALWIASNGRPDPAVLTVFVLGVVVMRSAGCVINDYADRRIDPYVERTRTRPIAAGHVSPRTALMLFIVLCLVALVLVSFLNRLTLLLATVALLLAVTYPFMKRYTHLPQVHLGAAFAWAVPMSFAAQTGAVPALAWLLFVAVVLWAVAYDTIYAMVDREDDLRIGVKSTAILFGQADRVLVGAIQLSVLALLFIVGKQAQLGLGYYAGLGVAALLAVYQQHLIRERKPKSCFAAFLNNNWFGAAVFAGIAIDFLQQR